MLQFNPLTLLCSDDVLKIGGLKEHIELAKKLN